MLEKAFMKPNRPIVDEREWEKMSVPEALVDEWWARLPLAMKKFLHDVIRLVEGVREDEALELRFNGRNFSPVLMTQRKLPTQPGPREGTVSPDPEEWWAGLPAAKRSFMVHVACLLKEVNGQKVLEFRNDGGNFTMTLVLKSPPPTQPGPRGGKAALN